MITRREKRLIALMDMQCFIYEESGHRWISEGDGGYLGDVLRKGGVALNNKIYGGWDEALDAIDLALVAAKHPTLEESFDSYFDEKDVTMRSEHLESRVDFGVNWGGLV